MVEDQQLQAGSAHAHGDDLATGPDAMHPMAGMTASPILTSAHKIAIAGLGLIGGSLARRLARQGRFVVAWNHTDRPYEAARSEGIHCVETLEELAQGKPDVLVLATPLKAMPEMLGRLAPVLTRGTTLTDVGSVKGLVRQQVREAGLSDRYVGGHPMAGSEFSGYEASDPGLLEGALWALTVDENTDYGRFLTVADMVTQGLGNRLIALDDQTHDRAAALISHMPHVVATALANLLVDSDDRNIAAALAAGSWRDMTRVALTDPDRTEAMVDEDADQVAGLLDDMAIRLSAVAKNLRGPEGWNRSGVHDFFTQARPFRDYKAELAGADQEDNRFELALSDEGWRSELLESARRGQEVEVFLTTHQARVVQLPTIGD
ncbi:Prephenate dehydrogenase [Bifidobacterium [indicum] DSM 20214 = LMG 11587]|uniref:Prephenate dehydrogenase n=2 Tax=Bifidobacterium coryneforme TaxID=1687 RepID=A0A087VTM6_9BIFI|nr:Prephenate dehydrogenase [Bifidobacterium indicum LMG 11587 = DSM 20214]